MKYLSTVLALSAFLLICLPQSSPARQLFVYGKVQWVTNTPAEGLTVKLSRNGQVAAATHTNARGIYVFYDLPGSPRDYLVQVFDRNDMLRQQAIPNLAVGAKLTTITVQ